MAMPARKRLSYAEYLALERDTGVKHEFLDGEVVAMAGGSAVHAILIGEVYRRLANALEGKPCQPRGSEQRIVVEATGLAAYADASVVCGPRRPHPDDPQALTNPTAVIEVLSDSTQYWDRTGKFDHYAAIPELSLYLLVHQHQARVELFRRHAEGWLYQAYGDGAEVPLPELGIALSVDALYAAAREEMALAKAEAEAPAEG